MAEPNLPQFKVALLYSVERTNLFKSVQTTNSAISKFYRSFKRQIKLENYLVGLNRRIFTKLRMSLLKLPITTGRYDDIPYEERFYPFCSHCNFIGDNYQYLLVCRTFQDSRQKYIQSYFWKYPSRNKSVP